MKTFFNVRFVGAVFLVFITLASGATVRGATYDSLFVFGDSLVDTGNDFILTKAAGVKPAIPPSESPHKTYFEGRFSNGYISVEYLWQRISGNAPGSAKGLKAFLDSPVLGQKSAVSFAFGGTGTPFIDQTPGGFFAPGLKGQVALFRGALRDWKPSKRALYVIVTGANDYSLHPFNEPMDPQDVVDNIVDAITSLYALGARDIVVTNLPDLGLLPANRIDEETARMASLVSAAHNQVLGDALGRLPNRLPRLNLIYVDMNDMLTRLPSGLNMTIPALEFFPPSTPPEGVPQVPRSACLFVNPATCTDVPSFQPVIPSLFWDIVHPTTNVHQVFGQYIFDQLPK